MEADGKKELFEVNACIGSQKALFLFFSLIVLICANCDREGKKFSVGFGLL
jgi:hypothetical protein